MHPAVEWDRDQTWLVLGLWRKWHHINHYSENSSLWYVMILCCGRKLAFISLMFKRLKAVFIALFIITKMWKQLKCPSMDKWINEMWYIHTMDYYLALKRNELLTHTTTWMNFENVMLSDISQTPKDNIVWFHSYTVTRRGKFIETRRYQSSSTL